MLICFSWRGGSGSRAFPVAAEAPERIGPGQTLPQIWKEGGKKGIFLQRNKAFYCPAPFAAARTHPFVIPWPGVSRALRPRQITILPCTNQCPPI